MTRCKKTTHTFIVTSLPILLLLYVTISKTDASSTQKNLVNLYTHSSNENSLNLTSPSQHQNEYQYRQASSKLSTDRHKPPGSSQNHELVLDPSAGNIYIPGQSYPRNYAYDPPSCKGRLRLNKTRGNISDGPRLYQINLQCTWLIDSGRNNATIRIRLHEFNTECNYDHLYIFDGDSIYSPLIAALTGDLQDFNGLPNDWRLRNKISNYNDTEVTIKDAHGQSLAPSITTTSTQGGPFEIKINSGKAFIYFHSDTAQSMSGFEMTYTIDSCPLDCSTRGECDPITLNCKCDPGYYGEGCQYMLCPNNCTSPINGICDKHKSCVCNQGFSGDDCSSRITHQSWTPIGDITSGSYPRAFHKAAVINGTLWLLGGRTKLSSNTNNGIFRKKRTIMASSFDLETRTWSNLTIDGTTGVDHLAELSGHSIVVKDSNIYIYGGLAMNNTILDSLSVLDTSTGNITRLSGGKNSQGFDEKFVAPLAVVGHSANIVGNSMYLFLGFNPIYGYLNFIQKYDLESKKWSLVTGRGSAISGLIGHTTVYDPISRLIYLYGGHNAQRSNSLYSFDPEFDIWTLLQPGPSPRFYHDAMIIDRQFVIIGGNSYNTSKLEDQCFRPNYLIYDLDCKKSSHDKESNPLKISNDRGCDRNCWTSIESPQPGIVKRHGHTVSGHKDHIILFGGFNGLILGDLYSMPVGRCESFIDEASCTRPSIGLNCNWNVFDSKCESKFPESANNTSLIMGSEDQECFEPHTKHMQDACDSRETCIDCLSTDIGCTWCGAEYRCDYLSCTTKDVEQTTDTKYCYKDILVRNPLILSSLTGVIKEVSDIQDIEDHMECKRIDNCFLCNSKTRCIWDNELCILIPANLPPSGQSLSSQFSHDYLNDMYGVNDPLTSKTPNPQNTTASRIFRGYDPSKRSLSTSFTTSLLNPINPYQSCDAPCYLRRSCNECISNKCIWCSTSEQCLDSFAYFAYHPMGQCMHYVAHMLKCPVASCSGIESCDKCLANPKCGWLNDIGNNGKGKCLEGTNSGPSIDDLNQQDIGNSTDIALNSILPNWYYTSCPPCQCNGHSICRNNSSVCVHPCQDNTEGAQCERCIQGYYGDPVNGGSCKPCRCNGHASTCHRETGKCYCSTKGIIGHNCNRCDDQNHYVGDPLSPGNGTCYYNLTTDYQYTFNMSKSEDHFYNDINFINVPLRKDSDIDFTIVCSRLALVNITSGGSLRNRKVIHSERECGSLRLRLSLDKFDIIDSNFSFYVHVHKFQTPFILQIAFSQHRTIYLPQVFFTFSR